MQFNHSNIPFQWKTTRALLICVSLYFVLAATLVTRAVGADTCSGSDTYANKCKSGSSCTTGQTCVVKLTYSAKVQASPDPLCVDKGALIQWIELTATYDFRVGFASSPFVDGATTFHGAYQQPSTPDAIDDNASQLCYVYTAWQCVNASCYTSDPKVIINPAMPTAPEALHHRR